MKKTLFLIFLAFTLSAVAQNKVVHKSEKNYRIPGYQLDMQGTFDYNYYEDARGEYVKHGTFNLIGKNRQEFVKFRKKMTVTETYTATGKYVDGWLDGLVTIKRRLQQNNEVWEWTLTANFKNGLPNGEWKTVYKDPGTTNTYAICHFKEGALIGLIDLNWWKGNNGDFTRSHKKAMKGEIDAERRYHGTWHVETTDGITTEYEFEHGTLYRVIERDKDGNVINKADQDPTCIQKAKEAATRITNGELNEDQLKELGFELEKGDWLNAHDIIGFFSGGEKIFARSCLGGQKKLSGSDHLYLAPLDYLKIKALPELPDYILTHILSTWENQAKAYTEKGSYDGYTYKSWSFQREDYDAYGYSKPCLVTINKNIDTAYLIYDIEREWNDTIGFYNIKKPYNIKNMKVSVMPVNKFGNLYYSPLYFYPTNKQVEKMDSLSLIIQHASFEGVLKNIPYTKKYYKIVPDTSLKPSPQSRHYYGYFKKGDIMEGCEKFDLIFSNNGSKLENITTIALVWDTLESGLNAIKKKKKTLENTDAIIYNTYQQNKGKEIAITNDTKKCRKDIEERSQTVNNYLGFAGLKKTIVSILSPKIEKTASEKPEFAEILANYKSFYNTIDFSVHDASASKDIERLSKTTQLILQYDTLINLNNDFYALIASIEVASKEFKHIKKAFQKYKEELHTYSDIDNLKQMVAVVDELRTILRNIEKSDMEVLNKEVKSAKEQSSKMQVLIGK